MIHKIDYAYSNDLIDYEFAVSTMEQYAAQIAANSRNATLWFLEHPPIYTYGVSAKPADLIEKKFPVYASGRGGQYTYHGPGQRIIYCLFNLKQIFKEPDIRKFIQLIEHALMISFSEIGLHTFLKPGKVGVWTKGNSHSPLLPLHQRLEPRKEALSDILESSLSRDEKEEKRDEKIAALGIRVKKWVSYHGVAININPNLSHYDGIVPCGIYDFGVTSLEKLGIKIKQADFDKIMIKNLCKIFNLQVDKTYEIK